MKLTRGPGMAFTFACACALAFNGAVARAQGTLADYQRANQVLQLIPGDLVTKDHVTAHWIGKTQQFWYVNVMRGKKEFILVDAGKATRAQAFDHAKLAQAITKATSVEAQADALPFDTIEFSDDLKTVRFRANDAGWICDLQSYDLKKDPNPLPAATPAGRGRRGGGAGGDTVGESAVETGRREVAPNGAYHTEIRDYNLWIENTADETHRQLTTDGTKENFYQAPNISPDGKTIAFFRTVRGDHKMMYNILAHPEGQVRPTLQAIDYALPGDKVDVSEIYVVNVGTGNVTKCGTDTIDYDYDDGGIPSLHWSPDGKSFLYRQMYRGYQRTKIMKVDAATGKALTVMESTAKTFIDPDTEYVEFLDDSNEVVWTSERDGWNHIYLLDSAKGGIKNQVTKGEFVVKNVIDVDKKKRQITFTAGGKEEGQDPYFVHYYRVDFDGTNLVSLTPADGTHTATFWPDHDYLIDTYSKIDVPPVTELRSAKDGKLVCELEKADAAALDGSLIVKPEAFVAKGRDGKTDIYGIIRRPSKLDPTKKYPVIEDIYAGPQGFFTPKAFSVDTRHQALCELGFIVVQVDGMGTLGRSKAFHDVCYKNLGDSGFPDRILWMKAAAAKYPYMDVTRVGVYGTSAGGYNAAHALIAHPEFYKVAVSNSGNQDHRTDKTWWNELWMGYPVGPQYAEQSNVDHAAELKGKLQLVMGGMDTNVNPFAATLQLAEALEKANKDFELVVIPAANHGAGSPFTSRKLWDFFVKNLRHVDPPEDFAIFTPSAGRGRGRGRGAQ